MNAKFETFLIKALYDAKIEEIVSTYRDKHFIVNTHVKIDEMEFDVIVKQGEKTIVFEIRLLPLSSTNIAEIDNYHKKAKALGYDFRLITIAKPKRSTIAINWLDKVLLEYFVAHPKNTGIPITTPVDYREIETAIQSIEITDSEALVYLDGNLSIQFQSQVTAQNEGVQSEALRGISRENDKPTFISDMLSFRGKLALNLSEHKIKQADLKMDNLM